MSNFINSRLYFSNICAVVFIKTLFNLLYHYNIHLMVKINIIISRFHENINILLY